MPLDLVEWALTRDCNLDCRHCHSRGAVRRDRDLDRDEALALSDQLARTGCRSITLSGGEPLLRPDWPAIADRLAGRGIFTQIVSNGSLLDRDAAERALDAGIGAVLLSLDGVASTHDRVRRRPGSYREVLAACDALDAVGVRFGFVTTLLALNRDQLEPLADLVGELDPLVWQVWIGMPPPGAARRDRLWLRSGDVAPLRRWVAELQQSCAALVPGDNLRTDHACPAGSRVLGIGSDGRVRGCLALPENQAVGSIRDQALEDLKAAVERRTPLWGGCRATELDGRDSRRLQSIGAIAAAALLASGLACGCSSTSNPPEPAHVGEPSSSPEKTEPESEPAKPPAIGEILSPSQMPPCCLSHMLIPDCVCSWKPAESAAAGLKLQIPSTGELKDIPGGVEIACRTGQTGLTPGRLKIVAHQGEAPLARPEDLKLKNGAVLHATGAQPAAEPGQPEEQTRTGVLILGEDSFEVTCWTESGIVAGRPALWPDWCAHALGTLEKTR